MSVKFPKRNSQCCTKREKNLIRFFLNFFANFIYNISKLLLYLHHIFIMQQISLNYCRYSTCHKVTFPTVNSHLRTTLKMTSRLDDNFPFFSANEIRMPFSHFIYWFMIGKWAFSWTDDVWIKISVRQIVLFFRGCASDGNFLFFSILRAENFANIWWFLDVAHYKVGKNV